jgi:hypothetical protein
MRRVGAVALTSLALSLVGASAAFSQPLDKESSRRLSFDGRSRCVMGEPPCRKAVSLTIRGHGSVSFGAGFRHQFTFICSQPVCSSTRGGLPTLYGARANHAILSEKPHAGWKFIGWRGACRFRTPSCLVHVSQARLIHGRRVAHVEARFARK